jgi:digeranylgeranylglycerophospholipid reductase
MYQGLPCRRDSEIEMKYDVIVVGAGPAGSATAKAAADKGAEVLVLEKRSEIGVPVQCGEAFGKQA